MKTRSTTCASAFELQFIGLDGRVGLDEGKCDSNEGLCVSDLTEPRNLFGVVLGKLQYIMNKCTQRKWSIK